MLKYLQQKSELTLFEGIKELREFEALNNNDMVETKTIEFIEKLEGHDVIHSLFGCETDVRGEIKVHLWMIFGTTTKMHEIKNALHSKDHKDTLKDIGHINLLKRWFFSIPMAFKIYLRSRRMNEKYDVELFRKDLNQKLVTLRQKYIINLI